MIQEEKLKRDYKSKPLNIINGRLEYIDRDDLYELYINQNIKKSELTKYFNISDSTLKMMLKFYGIKKQNSIGKEDLYELYINQNYSYKKCAEYFNVSVSEISTLCRKYNLKKDIDKRYENYKSTIKEIYNVENVFQSNDIKRKIKDSKASLKNQSLKENDLYFNEIYNYIKDMYNNVIYTNNLIYIDEINVIIDVVNCDTNKCFILADELKDKGYFMYHIFTYEWKYKKDKIKAQLKNLLQKNNEKIFARKCHIITLEPRIKNIFLDNNHLQGADRCNIGYGLIYNNELVSVMTFVKPRFNKKFQWELSRFASKDGVNVLGGASRLFNHFIKNYNPENIISYSDDTKTRGLIYKTLGFELDHISDPNYIWYKNINDYKTRYQCQKHKLLALGLVGNTEVEMMINNGYKKVYDCGNKVWIWRR